MELLNPYISPFLKPFGTYGSLLGGSISGYDGKLVFYNFTQTDYDDAIAELVSRNANLVNLNASTKNTTQSDGTLVTTSANTAAVASGLGDLIEGASTNLFVADYSADNVIIGAATGASKLTVATGDVETVVAGNGLIVLDASNGTRYRIYMDGGVLSSQLA